MDSWTRHDESGAELGRPVARPDIVDARDVFTPTIERHAVPLGTFEWEPWSGRRRSGGESAFNGYAVIEAAEYPRSIVNVELAGWAIDVLKTRAMGDLRFTLRAIAHDNGWTLILAQYDRIIGSVWLAYVRTDTVPEHLPEQALP